MPTSKEAAAFEVAVAAVQRAIAPDAIIEHDVRIEDADGYKHQFDVVIRTTAAGHDVLGLIECKHQQRPVGRSDVNNFEMESEAVNAHVRLMVSSSGFTGPARATAAKNGIGLLSPLDSDWQTGTVRIGVRFYVNVYYWSAVRAAVLRDDGHEQECRDPASLRYGDQLLLPWFLKALVQEKRGEEDCRWHIVKCSFAETRTLKVDGEVLRAKGVRFGALRTVEARSQWVNIHGVGFYSWHEGKLVLPATATFTTDAIDTRIDDGREDQDVGPSLPGWRFKLVGERLPIAPDAEVLNVEAL